jgi:hypothetical protein
MNAKRVTLHSLGEGGYASAGFAEVGEDATAVKPWSFTVMQQSCRKILEIVVGIC